VSASTFYKPDIAMSQNVDFDMQAAWLRRFRTDAESNLAAFALRLKEAMPDLVTVRDKKGLFSRHSRVTGVSVAIGDRLYTLELAAGRLNATVAMIVRGITLNTKALDPADWFARLAEETKAATEHAKTLSRSLNAFMGT
jgi:hypothetical protein